MFSILKLFVLFCEFFFLLFDFGILESFDSLLCVGQWSVEFFVLLFDLGILVSFDCLLCVGLCVVEFLVVCLDLGIFVSFDCLFCVSYYVGFELLLLSLCLYSVDFVLIKVEGCCWGCYSLFVLWINDVYNIVNYFFVIGFFVFGMSGVQIFVVLVLGVLMVYGLMNLFGYMGQKIGLFYLVMCCIVFGIYGV